MAFIDSTDERGRGHESMERGDGVVHKCVREFESERERVCECVRVRERQRERERVRKFVKYRECGRSLTPIGCFSSITISWIHFPIPDPESLSVGSEKPKSDW